MSELTVIKIGGSTLGHADSTLSDVAALHGAGRELVIVHGGGQEIARRLAVAGIEAPFVAGLRVTNEASIAHVAAALDDVNSSLLNDLGVLGVPAVGFDSRQPILVATAIASLGRVGEVTGVRIDAVLSSLAAGSLPVIAPLARDAQGLLNVNADTAAAEVALALHAATLLFMTDVEGLRDAAGNVLPLIHIDDAALLLADGTAAGGMAPKLKACMDAAGSGMETAILDGREPGALQRFFAGDADGTRVGASHTDPSSQTSSIVRPC